MPGLPLFGVPGAWPTADGAIPWRLFIHAYEHSVVVHARQQMQHYAAELWAAGRVWGDAQDQLRLSSLIEPVRDLAFPRG